MKQRRMELIWLLANDKTNFKNNDGDKVKTVCKKLKKLKQHQRNSRPEVVELALDGAKLSTTLSKNYF